MLNIMHMSRDSSKCTALPLILPSLSWPHALHLCLLRLLKKILPLMLVITPPNLNKKHEFLPNIRCHSHRKPRVPFARLLTMQRLKSWPQILTFSFPATALSWKISQKRITQNWSTSKNSPPSQATTSKKGLSQFRMQSCMQNPWRSMEVCT